MALFVMQQTCYGMQLSSEFWTSLNALQRKQLVANENVRVALADAEVEVSRYAELCEQLQNFSVLKPIRHCLIRS
jgi:hypothetical protein